MPSNVPLVKIPFARLMEYVAGLSLEEDGEASLAELARRIGEDDPFRLSDAIEAVKVVRGHSTDVNPASIRAVMHPLVRKALDADRGGVASGGMGSFFSD